MNLRYLETNEIDTAAALCARSFKDDPLFMFFFPNPKDRQKKACVFFRAQLKMCLSFTYVLDELSGIIIYQRPTDHMRSLSIKDGFLLIISVGIKAVLKAIVFQRFSKHQMKHHHQKYRDHLVLICVDEKERNKGYATEMIHHFISSSTYLETQNPHNIHFYQNLGFQLHHKEAFTTPSGSFDHILMVSESTKEEIYL